MFMSLYFIDYCLIFCCNASTIFDQKNSKIKQLILKYLLIEKSKHLATNTLFLTILTPLIVFTLSISGGFLHLRNTVNIFFGVGNGVLGTRTAFRISIYTPCFLLKIWEGTYPTKRRRRGRPVVRRRGTGVHTCTQVGLVLMPHFVMLHRDWQARRKRRNMLVRGYRCNPCTTLGMPVTNIPKNIWCLSQKLNF